VSSSLPAMLRRPNRKCTGVGNGRAFTVGSARPPRIASGGQSRQSWDFAYTVSMHADGLPFPPSVPTACAPLPGSNCAPPLDGQSLAWAFLTFGEIGRGLPPWAAVFTGTGDGRMQFELHEGSFEQSGLVHIEAGSSNVFGWSGAFVVGAVTFAAAIPEPATYAQMVVGLGLLAGAYACRGSLRRRAQDPSASVPSPLAA
jgi:hypothetical protein